MKQKRLGRFGVIRRDDSRHSGSRYRHCQVDIYMEAEFGSPDKLLSVRWQSDDDTNRAAGWYAARVTCEPDRVDAAEALGLAASLLRKHPLRDAEPLAWWRSLGLERRVYDCRVSEFVAVDKLSPPENVRWLARVDGECCVGCLAPRDDEEAVTRALVKEFAARIGDGGGFSGGSYYADKLERWITAGKPVELTGWGYEAPVVMGEAEVFESFKDTNAREQAEAEARVLELHAQMQAAEAQAA